MSHVNFTQERGELRICLLVPHFAEYGFAFAREMVRRARVLVVANGDTTIAEIGVDFIRGGCGGIDTHLFYKQKNPLRIALEAWHLVRAIRRFDPHVIHVQEDSKDALAAALPWLPRVPLVLTVHDPKPHSGADARVRSWTRHGIYIKQLRRRADAVVVHSDRLLDDARAAFSLRRIPFFSIPHGPLGPRGPAEGRREVGRCLFFGRIERYKGLRHFIAVIESLRARGIQVKGVVAGRGSDLESHRSMLTSARGIELIDRFLSPAEVHAQFERADVILMPYEDATQSGVAAFAIGMGRPMVAFDVGALGDTVRHGETGCLVPSGDVAGLVRAVERVVTDRSLNAELSAGALALGQGEMSWATIADRALEVYGAMLSKRDSCAG